MTTITLDVPDDLARRLKKFERSILIELLKKVLDVLELFVPQQEPETAKEAWRQSLLTISAWSDDEIQEIEKARAYINEWQPQELF